MTVPSRLGYFASNYYGHFNDCASQRFKDYNACALFARRLFGKWLGEQPCKSRYHLESNRRS